jgi:hypothetical protein
MTKNFVKTGTACRRNAENIRYVTDAGNAALGLRQNGKNGVALN